jgi:predicted oxidoreductase
MTVPGLMLTEGGPQVSRLALGLWRLADWGLTDAQVLDLIEGCLERGISTFDHADIYGDYGCEQLFGRALALRPSLRDKIQLVTKCGIKLVSARRPAHTIHHYDTSHQHIVSSAENSLRMFGTDRIDLLLIHRPDPLSDPDEIASAFARLKESGKVLHFGVSNYRPWQFELLASRLDFPLVTNQIELSVMHLEALHDGTVDQCHRRSISPMAWSPLGRGRLFHSDTQQAIRLRQSLREVGDAVGDAAIDQVALAWILTHPAGIVPVLGTGKMERIEKAAQAVTIRLSREQWFAIWTASTGQPLP